MSKYLENLLERPTHSFENYIEQIRLPFYKKIKADTKITFDFPLSVFVGPNGCGKTSVLQALYGCPKGYSTGDYWFSTKIDPIEESQGDAAFRFIYKYRINALRQSVEVIKLRRKRNKKPDYWETDKPRRSDNMAAMSTVIQKKELPFRSKSRWNPVEKHVVYIDFKAELSAFDKFFNFGNHNPSPTMQTKQDFIRRRSDPLQLAFKHGSSQTFHSRKTYMNYLLPNDALNWVSKILGKSYTEAQIVEHDFFNSKGLSILFKENNNQYSEAVAGSGEVAVVSCITKILSAPDNSLILLDEPEVSLHPGAQIELREFLLSQISDRGMQIILTTHSPSFIHGLPPKAIKVFHRVDGGIYDVLNEATPEQAFIRIGSVISSKKIIYVEDDLAKLLVEKAINQIDSLMLDAVIVKIYPGGGPKIKKDLLSHLTTTNTDTDNEFIFLDGDQKFHNETIKSTDIIPSDYKSLASDLTTYTNVSLSPAFNGGNDKNTDKKNEFYLKAFDTYNKYFHFGNTQTPEELIWGICRSLDAELERIGTGYSMKKVFDNYANTVFGTERSNSKDILSVQRMLMNKFPHDNPLWVEFVMIIKKILF